MILHGLFVICYVVQEEIDFWKFIMYLHQIPDYGIDHKSIIICCYDDVECSLSTGQKRCQICETFLKWDGIWCPCCGYRLRTRPRNMKYKAKLRARKKIDEYRLSLQQQQQPPIQVHKKRISHKSFIQISL